LARLPPSVAESLDESQQIELVEGAHEDPEGIVLARERSQLLDWAIQQLPPEWRTVFVLRELEGLSYAEIAEVLGIPIGTVESRLFRARQRLRQLLKPLLGNG